MRLDPEPDSLACAACGERVTDAGYLPAAPVSQGDDVYEPDVDAALCGACGFNDVGFAGCAPALGDVLDDPGEDTVLLQVRGGAGVDVVRVTDD